MSTRSEEASAVVRFSAAMLAKLRKNSFKAHWSTCSQAYLLARLREEVDELESAVAKGEKPERIVSEAADAGNFAMMIAENARQRRQAEDVG